MKNLLRNASLLLLVVAVGFFQSCKKDKDKASVTAGFTFAVDANDFRTVNFTNTSTDFVALSWNFGDGSALVTDPNPSHTFEGEGAYQVSLTATDENGKDVDIVTQTVTITDPDKQLTALVGGDSKTWKLLRITNGNTAPLLVGPIENGQTTTIWWGLGLNNEDILSRSCSMNDEWTFTRDGAMEYNSNGDFWGEGGVFDETVVNLCNTTNAANLVGPDGEDLSAFGDGTHTYTLAGQKLTVEGLGAFLGLQKIGTDAEVKVPQASVEYDILKLDDSGDVDTLMVETKWKFADNTSGADDAYWRITLVSYDDSSKEPAVIGFNANVVNATATFTNKSYDADSYSWDFGDGATSTEDNPTHTYTAAGTYTVTLTGTRNGNSYTATRTVTPSIPMTQANLVGGAWRVRNAANSVVVGPGLGNGSWWQVPADGLAGVLTGAEDWSCMTDDEFIFSAGGGFEYKTNGTARNDGYMGQPQGCWTDAEIAASGNGAAFGSSTHTWAFTDATATTRPIITLTNGSSGAPFIGFYKGFYGGENGDGANPPNGGNTTNIYEVVAYENDGVTETMTVSVDITAAHDGTAAWTMVMVR